MMMMMMLLMTVVMIVSMVPSAFVCARQILTAQLLICALALCCCHNYRYVICSCSHTLVPVGNTKAVKAGKASTKGRKGVKAAKAEVPVLKRSSRKRKPPASADASPVQSAAPVTHDRSIRKRALAAASELQQPAKAKKGRGAKKGVRSPPEHAVAQAVPQQIIAQQQPQGGVLAQQQSQVAQHIHTAQQGQLQPQVPADSAAVQAQGPDQIAASPVQSKPGNAQSPNISHPSALLQLAQQQMQQHLHAQSSCQQQGSATSSPASAAARGLPLAATAENSQLLGALGNATAQQAYLAQLISQQAAQANVHPFLLAAPYLAQLQRQAQQSLPAQPSNAEGTTDQDQSEQQQPAAQHVMPQLQQVAATVALQQAVAAQMPLLYAGHVINQAGLQPGQHPDPVLAPVQGNAQQPPSQQQGSQQQQQQQQEGLPNEGTQGSAELASNIREPAQGVKAATDVQPALNPEEAAQSLSQAAPNLQGCITQSVELAGTETQAAPAMSEVQQPAAEHIQEAGNQQAALQAVNGQSSAPTADLQVSCIVNCRQCLLSNLWGLINCLEVAVLWA